MNFLKNNQKYLTYYKINEWIRYNVTKKDWKGYHNSKEIKV